MRSEDRSVFALQSTYKGNFNHIQARIVARGVLPLFGACKLRAYERNGAARWCRCFMFRVPRSKETLETMQAREIYECTPGYQAGSLNKYLVLGMVLFDSSFESWSAACIACRAHARDKKKNYVTIDRCLRPPPVLNPSTKPRKKRPTPRSVTNKERFYPPDPDSVCQQQKKVQKLNTSSTDERKDPLLELGETRM